MPTIPESPLRRLLSRHAERAVNEALQDTRVVLINGARQCGKSTLVQLVGNAHSAEWRTLDRAVTRRAAEADPTGFVDLPGPMVIDEIQRVPELLLAIKEKVDTDPQPGRFLLTGSARVLGLRTLPDALPGRMETIELWHSPREKSTEHRTASSTLYSLRAPTCATVPRYAAPSTPNAPCAVASRRRWQGLKHADASDSWTPTSQT